MYLPTSLSRPTVHQRSVREVTSTRRVLEMGPKDGESRGRNPPLRFTLQVLRVFGKLSVREKKSTHTKKSQRWTMTHENRLQNKNTAYNPRYFVSFLVTDPENRLGPRERSPRRLSLCLLTALSSWLFSYPCANLHPHLLSIYKQDVSSLIIDQMHHVIQRTYAYGKVHGRFNRQKTERRSGTEVPQEVGKQRARKLVQ